MRKHVSMAVVCVFLISVLCINAEATGTTNYIETDYLRGSQKLINRYVILANEPICLFLWMTYLALTIFYYCDRLKGSKRIVWCSLLILVAGFIWGGDFSLSRSSFHENHSVCCVVLAIVYAVVLDIVRKRRNEK